MKDAAIEIIKEAADDFLPRLRTPGEDRSLWPTPVNVIPFRKVERGLEELDDNVSDSGGAAYRPRTRMQDPSRDPFEPWGGAGPNDSASKGYDHGWANCLMTSGGIGLDYHTGGAQKKWGGHVRHNQNDQVGGTDILDLKQAWARLGYTLVNRSGQGWGSVRKSLDQEKRGVMLQGIGNVPGAGTYTGAHAIYINPESRRDSANNLEYLICDPLVSGWQWIDNAKLRAWAERLNANVQFACTRSRA